MSKSIDEELIYLSDVQCREEELRKLNDELDSKLDIDLGGSMDCDGLISSLVTNFPLNPLDFSETFKTNNNRGSADICSRMSELKLSEEESIKPNSSAGNRACLGSDCINTSADSSKRGATTAKTIPSAKPGKPGTDSRNESNSFQSLMPSSQDDENFTEGMHGCDKKYIGADATIRLHKAKIKALATQLKDALNDKKEAQDKFEKLQRKLKEETNENRRLTKSLSETKIICDQHKEKEAQDKVKIHGLNQDLTRLKRDLASAQKATKSDEAEHKRREVRLSRALEECSKLKTTLAKATSEKRDSGLEARKDNDNQVLKIRSLERQRA
eukprot:CAMPEP_0195533206 /NCGR_PEP_ID=MMETSP0794_2-20130614/40031_1 /TAXON_ID=515487 /ORGANISM="Stephanopyxis turris, Strain CCMP 815" /LENGTH=327 /DNA_ID=CAMNT_0040665657 /DNA_START=64 /DNA_END=1043 /DNA_ORIENTATION=+